MENIGKIIGGGYSLGGYGILQKKGEDTQQNEVQQTPTTEREVNLVSADKVLDFMANNVVLDKPVISGREELTDDVKERVVASIVDFERFVNAATEEFDEDIALQLADIMSLQ